MLQLLPHATHIHNHVSDASRQLLHYMNQSCTYFDYLAVNNVLPYWLPTWLRLHQDGNRVKLVPRPRGTCWHPCCLLLSDYR